MVYLIRYLVLFLLPLSIMSQELDRVAVIVNDGVVLESDILQRMSEFKKTRHLMEIESLQMKNCEKPSLTI